MQPKPIDFDAVVAMKELSLQRELEELEDALRELSGLRWQIEYDLYRELRHWCVKAYEHFGQLYAEPPPMKSMYPVLQGTVSDWNFESAWNTYWDLSTTYYHSAPSALRCKDAVGRKVCCNYPGTTNLPQGRVESWFYKPGTSYDRFIGFCCRLQYPTWANAYTFEEHITDGVGVETFDFSEAGVTLCNGTFTEAPCNAWFRRRLTWWRSGAWLILREERWDGAAWNNDAGDCLDFTPSWEGSAINRCGLYVMGHATTEQTRVDDTTIYGP